MAVLSSDKKSVTVEKGDTLSEIARDFAQYSNNATYQTLAAINNIANPNYITIGQVIKLVKSGSSSSSTSSTKVTIKEWGLQSDVEDTLLVTWDWSRTSETQHYQLMWEYLISDDVWMVGNDGTTNYKYSTYNYPSNAIKVRFKVKPVSKERDSSNRGRTTYFTGAWSASKSHSIVRTPSVPDVPSVTVEELKLTAELNGIDSLTSIIEFDVVKNDVTTVKSRQKVKVNTGTATYSCTLTPGGRYKVRCRAYGNSVYSDWSQYSNNYETKPSKPDKFTECAFSKNDAIHLAWAAVENAVSYEIEYAKDKTYFDTTDQTKTISNIKGTTWDIVEGIEPGFEYFFRLRAVNSKNQQSDWSEISSAVIGVLPAAPTTWSSTTTAVVGEPLNLYWVHNCEDGSSQTSAELELKIDIDGEVETKTEVIQNTTNKEEKDKTSIKAIDTSQYPIGAKIRWRVRTAGVTKIFGDWSIERVIDIFQQPYFDTFSVTNSNDESFDILNTLPINISTVPGPKTQAPISYHLTVKAVDGYTTVDNIGNTKTVSAGEEIYSEYFDINMALETELSAGKLSLENNEKYEIICVVSMNSGLTAETSKEFTVEWIEEDYEPNAEIGVNKEDLTTYIRPYCSGYSLVYHKVTNNFGNTFQKTNEIIDGVCGSEVVRTKTTTGEQVYSGTTSDGVTTYYCEVVTETNSTDYIFDVYRREYDGTFTKLETELDAEKNVTITDPHPALDYARYRIVATSKTTGNVRYYDMPGVPIEEKAVIIQWDEDWTTFNSFGSADELSQPPWSGSMLKLPYNIDVSNKHKSDVALIEYIGRKHPVSYYGTQLGETATWNVEIDKSDIETLYALRRLAIWMGNVYVREPSGSGYWATISVSFNQKHRELTIPVTLDITRVEGGA